MEMNELVEFIKSENQRLDKFYGLLDRKEKILAKMAKLMEEVGELSEAVLDMFMLQRRDKDSGEVEKEFADVVITAMLLADSIGVDIEKAMEVKVNEIRNREY